MGMVKMKHINIYGPETEPKPTLEVLVQQECFDPDRPSDAQAAAADSVENVYAPLLTQTIGLLRDLGADSTLAPYEGAYYKLGEIRKLVNKLAGQLAERNRQKTEIQARLATYAQTKLQLYHLTNMHTNVDEIFACKYLKVRFGRLPKDSYLKLPYYADHSFTFREYDFDGTYYWGVYFVPENHAAEVDDIFSTLYFERMWVPDFVHGTPQDALAKLIAEENELKTKLESLNNLDDIAGESDIRVLRVMASWLNYHSQIFDMRRYVVVLEHSYYISGFVPEEKLPELQKALGALEGVKLVEDTDAADANTAVEPPVELKNNWFVRPFEMFVKMYGLPGYHDLDPSIFVALTYSVLFGAMFGDVGQGVVLGLVGYFVMYRIMHLEVGLVMTRCSVFSVFFGFIYGSVFGFEHALDGMYQSIGITFLPIHVMEAESINGILLASIAAGVFILTAAILTGMASNFKRHIFAKTIFSVNGLAGLVFYISVVLAMVEMLMGFDFPFVGTVPFYIVCLVVPFFSMYFAEPLCKLIAHEKIEEGIGEILLSGFFDMFDALLSFLSNTMSFLRVGGFVLAHAGMMSVVFTLCDMTANPVIYAIILIIGNIFVMVMEGLFVAIQVLRLEFYEIFSRFFDADGVPFTPLKIHTGAVENAA